MTKLAGGDEFEVRRAVRADIAQLPELCQQLGYPSTEAQVRMRFEDAEAAPERALFVAEAPSGALVGYLDIFVMRTIESEPRAEIAGLVVHENYRSRGVGELLIARAEKWAREHNCSAVTLRSNVIRERAHAFYERLGYKHIKTQKSFRKALGV